MKVVLVRQVVTLVPEQFKSLYVILVGWKATYTLMVVIFSLLKIKVTTSTYEKSSRRGFKKEGRRIFLYCLVLFLEHWFLH